LSETGIVMKPFLGLTSPWYGQNIT
jgi:hypothetical protein